jgi:phosphoribosylglycinamide formyltransferase-1
VSRARIAIFASGRGSNFEAIRQATVSGKLEAEIVALVCDNPEAPVIERARGQGIRAIVRAPSGPRAEHEAGILSELSPLKPDFLVLAGYMRILTSGMIEAFRAPEGHARIVNIHPSLLPSFPGVAGYAQAFEHGVKLTGATVHLVDEGLDNGPICAQEAFDISGCRSAAEVEKLGLEIENRLYPDTLRWVLPGKFKLIRRGRVCVSPN